MPHKKGHTNTPKQQEKYNILADRLADALITQDPNANTFWEHSGSTHVMSGPTFLNRHPELAEKYGITGKGQSLLVKEGKPTSLDSKVINQIPIDEVAMELKGERIPLHTKKPKPQPDIEYVEGYDNIVAKVATPGGDFKYGGPEYSTVEFYEQNSTTGELEHIGDWRDDFKTAHGQPVVNLKSSTGEPIQGGIEEVMDSLYKARPENVFTYFQKPYVPGSLDAASGNIYLHKGFGRVESSKSTEIRGEAVDKKTSMPKKYKKGGYVNKYFDGGEVTMIDPYQSNIGQGEMITSTMGYDTASSMGQTIDLGGYSNAGAAGDYTFSGATTEVAGTAASSTGDVALTGMQKAGMYAAYAKAVLDVGMGIKEGVEGTKAFYEDADDSMYYDEEAAEAQFKEARAQKVGAGAEAVGFTAGTVVGTALTGNPATGAAIGSIVGNVFEFVGENVSKLFGPGKKAKQHMKDQRGQHYDYAHNERVDAVALQEQKAQEKNLSEYLMQISNPGQKMYAELGGMLYGPSHAQGGIPIEAEGGEFIVRKSAIENKNVHTYTGTNKQIAEQINKNIYG